MIKQFIFTKFRTKTKYGTYRWDPWFVLCGAVCLNISLSCILGIPLYLIEQTKPLTNIKMYEDAVWLLWMSASTVGFGEVSPTRGISRVIVGFMTITGTMLIGAAVNMSRSVASSWANQKADVCNAELRTIIHGQNKKMLEMSRDLERIRLFLNVPDVVKKNDN